MQPTIYLPSGLAKLLIPLALMNPGRCTRLPAWYGSAAA